MATNPSVPPEFSQPPQLAQEPAPLSEGQRLADVFFAPARPSLTYGETRVGGRRSLSWRSFPCCLSTRSIRRSAFARSWTISSRHNPNKRIALNVCQPISANTPCSSRVTVTKAISYSFFILISVWNVIVAAVLLATLKFGVGAEVKFKTLLAVVFYSSLPGLLKSLLAIVSDSGGRRWRWIYSAESGGHESGIFRGPGSASCACQPSNIV